MPPAEKRRIGENGLVHRVRCFLLKAVPLTRWAGGDESGDVDEARRPRVSRVLEFSNGFVTAVVSRAASMALPDQVDVVRVNRKCALRLCVCGGKA